jgi:cell division protein FtsQ
MSKRKKILVSLFSIILLIAIVVGANIFVQNQNINNVEISIKYGKSDTIITSKEISASLLSNYGDFLKKQRKNVDEEGIEEFLLTNPYIESAEVYQTLKGNLSIEIKQREPIVKIYTQTGLEYYIDKLGKIIPIKNMETTDVVIASGNIDVNGEVLNKKQLDTVDIDSKKGFEKTLSKIFYIAGKLSNDTILNYQIDQIYVPAKGDYELIPKIGNYIIKVGEPVDIGDQFIKLDYLYREGFSRSGWDNYKIVDLRYRNQVVCTKKGEEPIIPNPVQAIDSTTQQVEE